MISRKKINLQQLRSLASGMALFAAARGAAAVIGLGAALILPHLIPAPALGQLYIMISAVTYLGVVMRFGGEYVLFRQSTLETDQEKIIGWDSKVFGQAVKYLAINSAIIFLVGAMVLPGLLTLGWLTQGLRFLAENFGKIIFISASTSMLVYLYQISKSRSMIVFSSVVKTSIVNAIFVLLAAVAFFRFNEIGVSEYIRMYLIASFLAMIIAIGFCRTISFPGFVKGIRTSNSAYYRSESWSSFLYSVFFVAFTEIEIFLASVYLDPAEVAVYATARRMTLVCSIFVEFGNVVLPRRIAANMADTARLGSDLSSFAMKMALIALLIIVTVLLLGDWVFDLLLPPTFTRVADVLPVLLLVPFVAVLLGPSEILMLMHSKYRSRLALSFALAVAIGVQVLLAAAWLVPTYGMFGLAWSSVMGMITYRTILMIYTAKVLSVRVFPGMQ